MKQAFVTAVMLLSIAAVSEAQTKPRWKLDFEFEKPQIYTYRNDLDDLRNYWFFTFTLTNNTDQIVPLMMDIMLYVEVGKALQDDIRKADPEPTKATLENARRYEALKFGRYYTNVVVPQDVEYKIIEFHSGIGNRSPGIVRESIEEFKKGFAEDPQSPELKGRWKAGDRLYLNPREMRQQRNIRPGQRLQGIAIFGGVDPRARMVELQVSGLWDVVRVDGYDPEEIQLHYENKVLKITYDFKGDEFEREQDILVQTRREWVIKAIGPIADKETLATLIDTMLERLKLEEKWASGEVKAEDVEAQKKLEQLTPLDMANAATVVQRALGKEFGYDPEKSVLDNKAAVWRIHEWWVTNQSKLAFNEATGRFDVREEKPPGLQE